MVKSRIKRKIKKIVIPHTHMYLSQYCTAAVDLDNEIILPGSVGIGPKQARKLAKWLLKAAKHMEKQGG